SEAAAGHHHRHDVPEGGDGHVGGGLGALAAVALLAFLQYTHTAPDEAGLGPALARLVLATAPWLVAGLVGAGLLAACRSSDAALTRRGGPLRESLRGLLGGLGRTAAVGAALPACRRFVAGGAAPAAALAALAAMTTLGLEGVLVSLPLL